METTITLTIDYCDQCGRLDADCICGEFGDTEQVPDTDLPDTDDDDDDE